MLVQDSSRKLWQRGGAANPPAPLPAQDDHGADAAHHPSRIIHPPRRLPSGRAVLGGLLVALAGLGTYLVAAGDDGAPTTAYAVASRDLTPGDTIGPGDLSLVRLDLPAAQAKGAFPSSAPLAGAVVRGPIAEGALINSAAVALAGSASGGEAPAPFRELTLSMPAARAMGGVLRPGDRVDVVATNDHASFVLAQHVLVLGAGSGRTTTPLASGEVSVTLALDDPGVALAVTHGAAAAELTLLRSTRTTDQLPAAYVLPGAPTAASPPGSPTAAAAATSAPAAAGPATAPTTATRKG